MRKILVSLALLGFGCASQDPAEPVAPAALVEPETLQIHGDVRVDPYYWLRERDKPEVIEYLKAENVYTQAVMAHTADLQEELFEEIKGRIKQDDSTPPYKDRNYYYYTRYREGDEYPIYCRKRGSMDAPEEIMLDVNELAEGSDFFEIGDFDVSQDENVLAYSFDQVGRRIYDVRFCWIWPDNSAS